MRRRGQLTDDDYIQKMSLAAVHKTNAKVSARQQFVYEGKGMVVKVKVWIGILDIALFTREDS